MRQTIKMLFMSLFAVGAFSAYAQAKTKLNMYYPIAVGGPLTKVMDGLVSDFEKKNPDIEVNAVYAGNYNDARVKSLAALKANEPVQLAVMLSVDIYDLIEQDAIVPFSDLAKTDEDKKWLNSFYPAFMENAKALGKTWSLPFQRSTIIMYYNKDMFKKAGLDPEKAPQTWDEMVSMSKQLSTKEHWGVMIPSSGYPYWMFGALTKENGKVLMSKDGKKTFFDDEKVIEALQFWKDLSTKYNVMQKGVVEWGTLRKNFLEGKTAMMWNSTGNLTAVKKNATFNFGVAMLPKNLMRGTPTGGGDFYIFKKSTAEERKAALKFIKFMTSPEISAKWSKATGYIGISEAAYNTPTLSNYIKEFPYAKVARDQLQYATAEFSTYQTGRVRKLLDDAIQSVLTGTETSKEALQDAQEKADKILKPYR
jgi:sn-glycerol 3-phosphate transport system substrate-binding protein